jgi:hypothetical protein
LFANRVTWVVSNDTQKDLFIHPLCVQQQQQLLLQSLLSSFYIYQDGYIFFCLIFQQHAQKKQKQ